MISDIHPSGMQERGLFQSCKLTFDGFDDMKEECYTDQSAVGRLIPCTLEGCVVRISDIIAYIGKDRQDAERLRLFDRTPEYSVCCKI